MSVLSVTYDLHREPGRNYFGLFNALKKFPSWCHVLESTWFVVTDMTPKDVYEHLKRYLHARDKLLIMPAAFDAGWWALEVSDDILEWLRKNLTTAIGKR